MFGLPPAAKRFWSPIATVLLRKSAHHARLEVRLSDALLFDAFRQGWMTPPISGRARTATAPTGHDG